MTGLQIEVIRTAVEEMFRKGHFSICTIDQCLKITGGVPDRKAYDMLHALHCVEFKSMSPRLRLELPRLVQLVIESRPMNCVELFTDKPIEIGTERKAIGE